MPIKDAPKSIRIKKERKDSSVYAVYQNGRFVNSIYRPRDPEDEYEEEFLKWQLHDDDHSFNKEELKHINDVIKQINKNTSPHPLTELYRKLRIFMGI